ncbi:MULTISPECIES: pseudouridine synthase [Bacillus]|uniref:Pseudouridine synthase n=2 Tax=Bacillus TaxID=1386 RepID=A0A0M4G9J5_9BACI|nr:MULTISPECIES: pseudouridine synthase [Bacillus]ALC82065.1 pseudouridine synthase [Bacillus gobiensis]MBP1083412.1 16S rRNA pseudouridine516 synthase [Bacillus capparidis]MED1097844.1 pseudouridine synthase [Bacillus capparidis]
MRLDKLLSHTGFGSRKDVKKLIKSGAVRINEQAVKNSDSQIDLEMETVTVHGERVVYREFIYLMMNKPPGVLSATEDARQKTVVDLLDEGCGHFDLFPVGRLDKDTEGLLLLTNDGVLAHQLLSPKKHVAKTYLVRLKKPLEEVDIDQLESGVWIDEEYKTKPAKVEKLHNENSLTEIHLTITEGKFHQIKRMAKAVQNEVIFLKRLSMGNVKLDPMLGKGDYRELTQKELELLQGS